MTSWDSSQSGGGNHRYYCNNWKHFDSGGEPDKDIFEAHMAKLKFRMNVNKTEEAKSDDTFVDS